MAQINWELHSPTLFQPFHVIGHRVCGCVRMLLKDILLSNQKKSDFNFFCFVLEISFDGIVQNQQTHANGFAMVNLGGV